jgi:catechol 2,3-dioxygenase-like lactoylglutathione lyase family enzyme
MLSIFSPLGKIERNGLMINHLSLGVRDLDVEMRFYDATLLALGYARVASSKHHAAYAENEEDRTFFIQHPVDRQPASVGNGTHVCFTAHTKAEVDAFYAAALAHGGTDDGEPGARYYPHYYAAFVKDPEGHKLEAVFIDEPQA